MQRSTLLVIVVALLAACTARTAQVRGVAPLNRNAEGESTPVDLRFYLLRDDGAFARAGFAALWTDPRQALGDSLIGQPVSATVLPGEAAAPPASVVLGTADAAWVGVQMLTRHEGELPRTLLLRPDRLPGLVVEASGYGLRLVERR